MTLLLIALVVLLVLATRAHRGTVDAWSGADSLLSVLVFILIVWVFLRLIGMAG